MTDTIVVISADAYRGPALQDDGWSIRRLPHTHRPTFLATKPAPPACPCSWPGDPEWCPSCGGAAHE